MVCEVVVVLVLVVVLVVVVGVQTEETAGAGRRPEYCRPAMAGRQRHILSGHQNTGGGGEAVQPSRPAGLSSGKRKYKFATIREK